MAEQIDPDAETTEGTDKPFGEHMKDAAHDLKEDVKDAVRRDKDDDGDGTSDEEGTSDDDGASDGDDEGTSGGGAA